VTASCPPADLAATLEPPAPGPDTEKDSPLLTVSEFTRLLTEFETRLTNRMLQSHKDQHEQFEIKLEQRDVQQKQHLARELKAVEKVAMGAAEGVAIEVRAELRDQLEDMKGRISASYDRVCDRLGEEFDFKITRVAEQAEAVRHALDGYAKIATEIRKREYDLAKAERTADDDANAADRSTLTEVK
jgi:putative lipoic acid-binding regulatory protein